MDNYREVSDGPYCNKTDGESGRRNTSYQVACTEEFGSIRLNFSPHLSGFGVYIHLHQPLILTGELRFMRLWQVHLHQPPEPKRVKHIDWGANTQKRGDAIGKYAVFWNPVPATAHVNVEVPGSSQC